MKKNAYYSLIALAMVLFGSCSIFDSPAAPEKTEVSAIFSGSDGKIYDGFLVDSVGKEIGIGVALYLPDNFDSISFKVVDSVSTVIDSFVREFKNDYFRDTVWIRHTFRSPGVKNVTITPFANPKRSEIISAITILPVKIIVDSSSGDVSSEYSVTYQKSADVTGTVPVDAKKYKSGDQVFISGNNGNLDKNGFTFTGWNTKEDGSGISYAGGATILIGSTNVVLYAQWTTNPTFKVVYNGNGNTGGTVPVDSNNVTSQNAFIGTSASSMNCGLSVRCKRDW